MGISGRGANA
jgi:hypothetical protein